MSAVDVVPPSDFFTFLTIHALNAPEEVMDQVVRQASVWFARETRVLEDSIEVHFQPNVRDYLLEVPDSREIIALDYSKERLHRRHMTGRTDTFVYDIFGCYDVGLAWRKDGRYPVVEFQYNPIYGGRHTLWYQWTPMRDACDIPRIFYEEWQEAITARALSELLRITKQDWTNVTLADEKKLEAQGWVETARARRFSNYTQGDRRAHARPFLPRTGLYGWAGRRW